MHSRIITNFCCIINGAENELGGAVIAGADVRDIRLAVEELLGAAKVTELQYGRLRIEQKILRLDITMAYAQGVDVGQTSKQLVHVELQVNQLNVN